MIYKGIELEFPAGDVSFSHSVYLDMIRGQSGNQNVEWMDKLGELPWGRLRGDFAGHYKTACLLFSLYHMDYQTCNGGIAQYFCNGYHEHSAPLKEIQLETYAIDEQKEEFLNIVKFAREIFPDRVEENNALQAAADAFQEVSYEEDVPYEETIECDEDEYIFDEELGEEVRNPDWFEPYDETSYENVIHNETGFEKVFYEANDYLEELLEIRAQLCCKELALEVERSAANHGDLCETLKGILPASAFRKPSLAAQIENAQARAGGTAVETPTLEGPEHESGSI